VNAHEPSLDRDTPPNDGDELKTKDGNNTDPGTPVAIIITDEVDNPQEDEVEVVERSKFIQNPTSSHHKNYAKC